jgi:hypothetical protein
MLKHLLPQCYIAQNPTTNQTFHMHCLLQILTTPLTFASSIMVQEFNFVQKLTILISTIAFKGTS